MGEIFNPVGTDEFRQVKNNTQERRYKNGRSRSEIKKRLYENKNISR